jgi:hypothetical protein
VKIANDLLLKYLEVGCIDNDASNPGVKITPEVASTSKEDIVYAARPPHLESLLSGFFDILIRGSSKLVVLKPTHDNGPSSRCGARRASHVIAN